jgi:hypothetical protein
MSDGIEFQEEIVDAREYLERAVHSNVYFSNEPSPTGCKNRYF